MRVAGLPPALTRAVSQPQIDSGQSVAISGVVNSKRANEQVAVTAQPWGQPSVNQAGAG